MPGMFIIIGGDSKEYGPVTAEQVRVWIAAGRVNLDTRAKAVGSEEWLRVGDFPEFKSAVDAPPVVAASIHAGTTGLSPAEILPPASRGVRLAARAIDWSIELIAAIPGASILGPEVMKVAITMSKGGAPDISQLDMQRVGLGATLLLGAWLLLLIIQVWLLSTRGQSLGKVLMKVRIVRFADQARPGILYAWLLREVPMTAIGMMLGFLPIIGPFLLRPAFHLVDWCMIFRDDQRCLHDLIAGTKVVRADVSPFTSAS